MYSARADSPHGRNAFSGTPDLVVGMWTIKALLLQALLSGADCRAASGSADEIGHKTAAQTSDCESETLASAHAALSMPTESTTRYDRPE
eukprot:3501954-Prymnesium_polylepis.3